MKILLQLNHEKLQSLRGQLSYTNEALSQKDIKQWEVKEFQSVKSQILSDISETEKLIESIKTL